MHDVVFFLTNTSRHLLAVSFITCFTVKFVHRSNHKEDNSTTSHAQNTTALQPSTFLSEIHQLLITKKRKSAFPSANNCQGQLQTHESVSEFKADSRC